MKSKMLENKYLWVYVCLTLAVIFRTVNEILILFNYRYYSYGWENILDVVFYIAVCVFLMINTNQVCDTNNHKMLILPATYLIWYQVLRVYYTYKATLVIANLSLIVMALLISIVCLIIFKNKQGYLPLILACFAGVFQIIDTVPTFITRLNIPDLFPAFVNIQQFIQLITNLYMFAMIIVFLCINQKNKKHIEEIENKNNAEIVTSEFN
jgi:hypothetical protein